MNAGGNPGGGFSGSLLVVTTVWCPACAVGCGNSVPKGTWGGALIGGALIGGAVGYPALAAYPATTAVGCAFITKVYGLVVIPTISVLLAELPTGGALSFGGGAL